jgi:hypothetical protein
MSINFLVIVLTFLLEDEAAGGRMKGLELFLFTNNYTAQSAYYNVTSSSKKVFELVLHIRSLILTL